MTGHISESHQNLVKLSQAISSFYAGDFESAEPVFREGAAFFAEGSEELSECLQRLSTIYTEWGRANDAARLNVRLLAILRKTQGPSSPELEPIMLQLADLYERMGRMEESMQMLQRIELLKRGELEEHHPDELDRFESELYAASSEFVDQAGSSGYFKKVSAPAESADALSQSPSVHQNPRSAEADDRSTQMYDLQERRAEQSPLPPQGNYTKSRGGSSARDPHNRMIESADGLRKKTSRMISAVDNPVAQVASRIAEPTKELIARTWDAGSRLGQSFQKAILPVSILSVVLFVAAWFVMPRAIKAETVFESIPHDYRSVDGKVLFALRDLSNCTYTIEGSPNQASYAFFLNDWRDVLSVAFGPLVQKSYLVKTAGEAIEGEDGTRFYAEGSKGQKVLEHMSRIADASNPFYDKKKKVYAGSVISAVAKMTYTNPYTKKNATPVVQSITLGSSDDELKAEVARSMLDRDLSKGQKWSKESPFAAGAIHCALITLRSPGGDSSIFVIRGFDGSRAPFRANSSEAYSLMLENGKMPSSALHQPPFSQPSVRRQVIWYFPMSINAGLLAFLTNGPVAILMGSSVLLLILIFGGPPEMRGRMALPLAASVLAAAMLSFSDKLP